MTRSELVCMKAGDVINASPLMSFGGLALGGVELIFLYLSDNIARFDVRYLGVHIGRATARMDLHSLIHWEFKS